MMKLIYFIDEDEAELRSGADVLTEIFASENLKIHAQTPLPTLLDYAELVDDPRTAAFILDQRLDTNGLVSYSGIELAQFLRSISSKLPIVILTNFPKDDFGNLEWTVERIFQKSDMLRDPNNQLAQKWKARLLRQIDVFDDILESRERRFHHLLVKSLKEKLSADEEKELGLLETERVLPLQAVEIVEIKQLEKALEELRKRISSNELPME